MSGLAPTLATAHGAAGHAVTNGAHEAAAAHAATPFEFITPDAGPGFALLILALPLLASVLCGVYAALGIKGKFPAWSTVVLLAGSFVATLMAAGTVFQSNAPLIVHGFDWISLKWGNVPGQSLTANFSLFLDQLTVLWMLFVTGLATLIALYASEYMAGDRGYARFFGFFALFVFMMSCLVMGDSLVLLYLGWEGVGLCSYLLIGFLYKKPSAVAAAKKAFIVNRIGDLGLALGLMLAFTQFGSLEYKEIFRQVAELQAGVAHGHEVPWSIRAIPLLLMVGAFGKSAQLPLYVWLPDAMEGPTPVSALIHAATMVTAGVYLIARFLPVFELNPAALNTVAWIGCLTAFFAATIGMATYDIKRVMAYSTVSQLGYMFLGLGVLSSAGAGNHVVTHAFFKATLFLACGAVMHGFAGQLDLRRLSGLWHMKGWKIVSASMLVGCLCLAGFPLSAGFFSKDMIIAESFVTEGFGGSLLGLLALLTAGLTAYYTFRVFFRVFVGPVEYHAGDEHHGDDAHDDGHGFHPHAPGWAINTVLVTLSAFALAASIPYLIMWFGASHDGWITGLVSHSTAKASNITVGVDHTATFLGANPHFIMYFVSGGIGIVGILVAWLLHFRGRTEAATSPGAEEAARAVGPILTWATNKWYVDEFYDFLLRKPLWFLAHVFYFIDALLVDGIVNLFGWMPRAIGGSLRPSQNGFLQSYAVGMTGGLALLLVIVWIVG
ncbi:MAG: NADH-quinone oxidoreductase subunit L [Phycisphaeraceae bacterium]|nr:NADH-quinone oxidoreductase subunit L [Phycisphaeraceae bacterium]